MVRACAVLLLAAVPWVAQGQSLALLTFSSAGADADALTTAARAAILEHTALDLVSVDALPFDRSVYDVRKCAGRPACFVELAQASAVRFDVLLVLGLDHLDDAWTLSYRLIDAEGEVSQRAVGVAVSHDVMPSISTLVDSALREALAEHWDRSGELSIRSTPSLAEAALDRRSCVTPCVLSRLPIGRHALELRAPGHTPVRHEVVVVAGAVTSVDVTLEPEGSLLGSPWLWVAIAAVASAGVVAAVAVASGDSGPLCYSPDQARCP